MFSSFVKETVTLADICQNLVDNSRAAMVMV